MEETIPFNYNGDNMLIGANRLNIDIKNYMDSGTNDIKDLEEFTFDIEEYLRDILHMILVQEQII